jgi:hypothetical protein
LGCFDCFTCGRNTSEMGEYYVVRQNLWKAYGVEGMLCIGCFETRLGRRLTPAEFIVCDVNKNNDEYKSERLLDRLGRPPRKRTKRSA